MELELELEGVVLKIGGREVSDTWVYRIEFSDGRKSLIITKAVNSWSKDFWTSIPQGRLEEAESIGELIDKHLKQG